MKRLIILISIALLYLVSCKQEVNYTISTKVQPPEGGSIIVTPSSGFVLEGTSVSFTANPNGDYVFTGWSGSISGTENPKTVTATSDMSVVANFTLKTYPLTLSVEGEGTVAERVISTKTEYGSGTVVELTAKPSDHWLFDHWEGDLNGNTNPVQITVSSPKSVKAVFVKKMYDLTVSIDGEGAVSETVRETRSGSYQEGTVVELNATPATGWSFNHWEGDLSGSDNPVLITISGSSSVKAVFTKNKYAYNLKIVGPGVVDEFLIQNTKASLEYGTQVLLKAVPAAGAVFEGWSGSVDDSAEELFVRVTEEMSIVATFRKEIRQYPRINYMLPSVQQKCLYYGIDYSGVWLSNVNAYCPADYDDDGYIDLVINNTDWSPDGRFTINFLKGTKDGFFLPDEKNNNRMLGLNNLRKFITGDYNGDGLLDYFLIGHGYDAEPWPGEYPVALLSNLDGTYTDLRLTDMIAFYHGGASADFDNDGDLDIVLVDGGGGHEVLLKNDGLGHFDAHYELLDHYLLQGFYTAEFFDINQDGYVDFIAGLDDVNLWNPDIPFDNDYNNMSIVFWGNGETYNQTPYTRLPKTPYHGMGLVLDYEFFDIDGDGTDEVFVLRTGDGIFGTNYTGWAVQIVKLTGESFTDVTDQYLSLEDGCVREGDAVFWIDFEEINGVTCLIARKEPTPFKMFELRGGRLVRPDNSEFGVIQPHEGVHIYCEGGMSDNEIDFGCQDCPYAGSTCIKISNWRLWTGFNISLNPALQNGMDLSYLRDNDYALEFFIKTTDPFVEIHFKLNSIDSIDDNNNATFCYAYRAGEHNTDGQWERISIPLKEMDIWNPKEDYMKKIDHFNVIVCSESGKDIFLDEIRIRKVLP